MLLLIRIYHFSNLEPGPRTSTLYNEETVSQRSQMAAPAGCGPRRLANTGERRVVLIITEQIISISIKVATFLSPDCPDS